MNELYLSGGGDEHQSRPLDSSFFERIPREGCLLYVPIALRGNRLYETADRWMSSVLALHDRTDIKIVMWDDAAAAGHNLAGMNAVYIGGGNTWGLIKELSDAGFKDTLQAFASAGGIVYGGSAGAILLGARIDTQDDENRAGWADTAGFGLAAPYSFACHFKKEQLERFRAWARERAAPIVCLPEEGGAVMSAGILRGAGATIVVCRADGSFSEVLPGEALEP